MTVREMLSEAMELLGYLDVLGTPAGQAGQLEQGVAAVNRIAADLAFRAEGARFRPLTLDDPIPLPDRLLRDVMPWGVAMLLAQGEGDAEGQALCAALYNRKRICVAPQAGRVADVLPKGEF